jgi:hypothetical protein
MREDVGWNAVEELADYLAELRSEPYVPDGPVSGSTVASIRLSKAGH